MQFDMIRLQELAGVPVDKSQGVLSEGKKATSGKKRKKSVNEAASRDTLVETKLRAAIRKEISAILEDLETSGGNSKWMHQTLGQPQNSQKGRVTRGFMGLGFK